MGSGAQKEEKELVRFSSRVFGHGWCIFGCHHGWWGGGMLVTFHMLVSDPHKELFC